MLRVEVVVEQVLEVEVVAELAVLLVQQMFGGMWAGQMVALGQQMELVVEQVLGLGQRVDEPSKLTGTMGELGVAGLP